MTTKQVLVCSYHAPSADQDSGARRLCDFLRFFQEAGWGAAFLAADGIGDERAARRLRQQGIPVFDGPTTDLRDLLAARPYDLALLAFWRNGERCIPALREVSPRTRVIVDSVDLHFLREARRAFQGPRSSAAVNHLDDGHASRMAREINTYAAADGVLAVSEKEAHLINDLVGDPRLAYTVPDGEELGPPGLPFAQRKGILSVGSFQHHPNVGAVEYLCKDILPRLDDTVAAEHPVYVVGNALNDTVRGFAKDLPHVRMVGWVPSVEPYFSAARISVVPLLYGAGTKRKVIQALMTGTPTVSTRIGVEGLPVRDGEHVLIADDASRFAECMTRLLTDPDLWTTLAEGGRSLIAQTHSRALARGRFQEAVGEVLARTPKGPPRWEVLQRRVTSRWDQRSYQQLTREVQVAVRGAVPPGATVAVVSKGDPEMVRFDERRGKHFPQGEDGGYAGHYPADGASAVAHLEAVRRGGAEFLVIPGVASWWLDHYPEFRQHLESHYREVSGRQDVCLIYALRGPNGEGAAWKVNGLAQARGPAGLAALANEEGPARLDPADRGVRLIAFYLPQFHPIPENDHWWGEGFTEWRNVVKAEPLFARHYQPHVPADLGFYDLRSPETREHQAEMAREYGIHGFCYYHYWFSGKRLLDRPFNEVLASGKPDFPFCLCWANDPWSRRWDGRTQDLLQAQTYSPEDDLSHIRWLLPALSDPRAIQADGKPLFLVYRAKDLPDARRTTETWREEVRKAGLPGVYLVAVETAWDLGWDATAVGFDAKVLFQPQFGRLITSARRMAVPGREGLQVYDYGETWRALAALESVSYTRFDTVFPGWDNTARRGADAVVFHNSTPDEYARWLVHALEKAQQHPASARFVFINAWNEWAEGCHLEPDLRSGRGYLEATRHALDRCPAVRVRRPRSELSYGT
jgi:glycosyltransferase involved in cell wall biosynthesis